MNRADVIRAEARRLRALEFEAHVIDGDARALRNRAARLADEVHSLHARSAALEGTAQLVRNRSGIDTSLILRAEALEAEAVEAEEWAARQGASLRSGALRRDVVGFSAAQLLAEAEGLEGIADDLERDGQTYAAAEHRDDAAILRRMLCDASHGTGPDDESTPTERS